jgi:hypothetical protein
VVAARKQQRRSTVPLLEFVFERGVPREVAATGGVSFTLTERSPAEGDPTAELQAFTQALLRAWAPSPFDGC